MAKVLVEVLDAVVDGYKKGAQIEIDANSADFLTKVGYVMRIEKPKAEPKAAKKSNAKRKTTKED